MKRTLLLLLVFMLQISCSSNAVQSSKPIATIATQVTSPPTPFHTPIFEIVTWFDNPEPELGSRVILYGSLIKDGVHLGGMAMRATWSDENLERGVPNCSVQVIYGSGVCIIETAAFQSGEYIPITVSFEYQGRIYSGQTGFTPH
jgi:hypothetical protein